MGEAAAEEVGAEEEEENGETTDVKEHMVAIATTMSQRVRGQRAARAARPQACGGRRSACGSLAGSRHARSASRR